MNPVLQKKFSKWYSPELTQNRTDGASSWSGTCELRDQLQKLFHCHGFKSIFDAGCNDCNWMNVMAQYVEYKGGDISLAMVANVWKEYPELDVVLHDITTDPIPTVDLLFVRDVAIHLNNADKKKLLQNWIESGTPWILITHSIEVENNTDFEYCDTFPFSEVNWEIAPWNFPSATDAVWEYNVGGRSLSLWHRDQLRNIL